MTGGVVVNESRCRQNFHAETEAAISQQINMELHASYVYLAMSSFCDRDNVSLPGMCKFFGKMSHEEREHAQKLIEIMAKRGGVVAYAPIAAPPDFAGSSTATTGLSLLKAALEMERAVNASLLKLHEVAEQHGDAQLEDFLEQHFLDEQVDSIKQIADLITQLERAGCDGLGLYLFDRNMPEPI